MKRLAITILLLLTVTAPASAYILAGVLGGKAATYAPNAPTGVTATPGNAQNTISWTASAVDGTHSAATSYNLLRSTTSGAETLLTSGVTSGVVDAGLTNGAAYYYKVQAANITGTADSAEAGPYTPTGPVYLADLTSAQPTGAVYVADGANDPYPSGNSTAADVPRAHFDFTGWQTGKAKSTVVYEFQGADDNKGNLGGWQHRYALKLMAKPYTETGVYPSIQDNPLYRFIVDAGTDGTKIYLGSYRYSSAGLTSWQTSAINLTKRYRMTVTIDQSAHTLQAVLYNVTDSVQVYSSANVTMDQNLAEMATVQPGTAIFEGLDSVSSAAPTYSAGNGIYMKQQDTINIHYGYFKLFSVTQQ